MTDRKAEIGDFPFSISDGPEESRYLIWIRNHANYLVPRGFLDYLRAAAVIVRGILINFLVLLPILLLGAWLLSAWHFDRLQAWEGSAAPWELDSPYRVTPWVLVAALVYYLLFPVIVRLFKVARQKPGIRQGGESSVKARNVYERTFGGALLVVAAVALVETLPVLIHWFHGAGGFAGLSRGTVAGWAGASSVGALSMAGKASTVLGRFKRPLALALVGILGLLLPALVVLYVAEYLVYSPAAHSPAAWWVLQGIVAFLAASGIYSFFKGWRNVGFVQTRFILLLLILILAIGAGLILAADLSSRGVIHPNWLLVLAVAVVLWLFSWLSVDVNLTAVSGFYRDRLASSYLVGRNTDDEVDIEEDVNLVAICQYDKGSTAPYHLVNTALNLQASEDIGIRERQSDFCIFSKRFIGGRLIGYCRTADLEAVFPQMDLATAMAISAAAAAPNMGRGTSAPLVAILTLFNVRLGYWIPNPGRLARWVARQGIETPAAPQQWTFGDVFRVELEEIRARRRNVYPQGERALADREDPTPAHGLVGLAFSGGGIRSATVNLGLTQALHEQGVFDHVDYMSTVSGGGYLGSSISTLMRTREPEEEAPAHPLWTLPNRFRWRIPPRAFLKEMWSRLDETDEWVNLSDGGHIENLATIELLRRRCKYIIIGDAEADPEMRFGGMATLIRFARLDLGVDIRIDLGPVHVPRKRGVERRLRLSEKHFAVGTIKYPGEAELGHLLYFKSSVTGDEDEVIAEYRSRSATFPHETTADQFFDEGQFEAYRSLGEHMARSALGATERRKDSYAALAEWFEELAR
ncbi:MAG: patatin-like phospholipase family protein [Acidobacteriota bacterium]|nr:patatin-like phospholipase family protein [Acidobacteriota bacterium]